jgi:hypothetical protein
MCIYLQFDSIKRKDAFITTVNVSGPALQQVSLATAAILPNAPVYAPITQTLTQTGAPAALLIDATAVAVGMRVLIKNQVDPRENGIYTVLSDNPWQLQRSLDFNQVTAPMPAGTTTTVTSGPTYTGTAWSLVAKVSVMDPLTDNINFAEILWLPNPNSTPTNYKVAYTNFNTVINKVTKEWREHCKKTQDTLSYYVDTCVVSVPGGAYINRLNPDNTTSRVYLTEEPYIYIDVYPTDHSEGNKFATNNPEGYKATFIAYTDKVSLGTTDVPPVAPAYTTPSLNSGLKWIHFKTCMRVNLRLDLKSTEWVVRMYDRHGHDIILQEDPALMPAITTASPPPTDPEIQTSILLGISPLDIGYTYETGSRARAAGCS